MSSVRSPARCRSAFTLMQMNLCLSGLAGCYGKAAYPAVVEEAVVRIRDARPDAVTLNEACRGDVAGMAAHPKLGARDRWTSVGSEAGEVRAVLPPIGLRDAAPRMDPIPALGERTDTVLAELGYSADDIADLRRTAVIA